MEFGLSGTEWWMTLKKERKTHNLKEKEESLRLGKFKGIYCYRCSQEGHFVVLCPEKIQKKTIREDIICFKCKKKGHFIRKCPKTKKKPMNLTKEKKCYRCRKVRHVVQDCQLKKGERPAKATPPAVISEEEGMQELCNQSKLFDL